MICIKNKEENTMHNQLFMGEVGRVKAELSRVSGITEKVFSKRKKKVFITNMFN